MRPQRLSPQLWSSGRVAAIASAHAASMHSASWLGRRPYHFCYVDGVDNNNNVLTADGRGGCRTMLPPIEEKGLRWDIHAVGRFVSRDFEGNRD